MIFQLKTESDLQFLYCLILLLKVGVFIILIAGIILSLTLWSADIMRYCRRLRAALILLFAITAVKWSVRIKNMRQLKDRNLK